MLLMGKLTISMAIFNSYVKLPEGNWKCLSDWETCTKEPWPWHTMTTYDDNQVLPNSDCLKWAWVCLCKVHAPKYVQCIKNVPPEIIKNKLSKPTLATVRTCPGNDLWLLEYPNGETNRRFPRTWQESWAFENFPHVVLVKCLWSKPW